MTHYLTVFAFLTACAAEPATSTAEQSLCQLDPVTGQCKGLNPTEVRADSRDWVHSNYSGSSNLTMNCGGGVEVDSGRHTYSCAIGFDWFGTHYVAGCVAVEGEDGLDCGIEEGD